MKHNKKFTPLLIIFLVAACSSITVLYAVFRLSMINQGFSLSDFFTGNYSNQINSPAEDDQIGSITEIPGINRTKIDGIFTKNGFTCSEPEESIQGLFRWVCWKDTDEITKEVYFFSTNLENIIFLDANINQKASPQDEIAVDYLAFIASLPDCKDQHDEITNWIRKSLPKINEHHKIMESEFANTQFRIYGLPEARSLEIGFLP